MPPMAVVNVAPNENEFVLNGARYVSAREIARTHGYDRDYIARLCRQGKVSGHRLGRHWYVHVESFADFIRRTENPNTPEAALTMVRIFAAAVFLFILVCAPASSALGMAAPAPANNQTLITLYTQLLQVLQQELSALSSLAPATTTTPTATATSTLPAWLQAWDQFAPKGYVPGFGGGGGSASSNNSNSNNSTPSNTYVAKAVHFDGATAMSSSALTGTDNQTISISTWIKSEYVPPVPVYPAAGSVRSRISIFQADGANFGTTIYVLSPTEQIGNGEGGSYPDSTLEVFLQSADGNNGVEWVSASPVDVTKWSSLLINASSASFDDAPVVYLNDAPVSMVQVPGFSFGSAPFNIDLLDDKFWLNDYDDDSNDPHIAPAVQDMSDTWIDNSLLDFTVTANRRKFIDSNGKPVDISSNCSDPTGSAPAFCFSGHASTFGTNQGTGGAFTLTGSLTNATSSPSD
jgi:hypothetical protein